MGAKRRGRIDKVKVIIEPVQCSPEERDRAWFAALEVLHRLHVKQVREELKGTRGSREASGTQGEGTKDSQ